MIWEREYHELERLHHRHINGQQSSIRNQSQLLKKDHTFLSLKHMSESTDVDDQEHDNAVFLLKNFYPDDESEMDDDTYSLLSSSMNSPTNLTHVPHSKSTLGSPSTPTNTNTLGVKPQNQHIRSVTASDKKPAFFKRLTTRHSEALSLYDTMVMKARKSRIYSSKTGRRKSKNKPLVATLKHNLSAPTPKKHQVGDNMDKPSLETIHSQNSSNDDEFKYNKDIDDDNRSYSSVNTPRTDQEVRPYKLEDDEIRVGSELTPEPPLFDPAFRQLTTNNVLTGYAVCFFVAAGSID